MIKIMSLQDMILTKQYNKKYKRSKTKYHYILAYHTSQYIIFTCVSCCNDEISENDKALQ